KLVVIGAGAMGLAAAYHAVKAGHQVEVLEASDTAGGMAAHFDFGGLSIEKFYHFVCKTDYPTFELMGDLGISDRLRWINTTMGLFTGGKLHKWGDPVSLLRLPDLGLVHKFRYALFAAICVRRDRWAAIETESAKDWLVRWCGHTVYERLWRSLLDYKFYEYANNISAAWIWTRIRRIGRSRSSIMQEHLGYIEGGSMVLIDTLVREIERRGGQVRVKAPVRRVTVANQRVTGVDTPQGHLAADFVISTVPTPYVTAMVPDLPDDWKARYESISNIGVICVTYKLRRSVSPHFWVNISEPNIEIPGVIEFSNLRSVGDDSIVYVPYYMPVTHERFTWPDQQLVDESFDCLQKLNAQLSREDIIDIKISRLRHGQPICEPGFAKKIPPVQTPIRGLQIADTCFYYPEDRGIAESVRLGRMLAESIEDLHE
ncbi:MAG TPA: NAD(P)/FAD-dependent oxidoreductase, partial [Acidobacteriaceae bacterium]|nr:NAD(P)/FAD-dependent oxidoreductase [Acidobacteriaceae bacterium]